jgi:hypothetical protein
MAPLLFIGLRGLFVYNMRVILDALNYTVEKERQKPCLYCDKSTEKFLVYSLNHNTLKNVKPPLNFTHYVSKMMCSMSKDKYGQEINSDPWKNNDVVIKNELFFCDEVCVNLFLLACMD